MVTFEYNTAETSAEMNKEELNTELQTLTYVSFLIPQVLSDIAMHLSTLS